MAAFSAAVSEGVSPVEFWNLTPYLAGIAMKGTADHRTKGAWMTAALYRQKKFPELKKLLSKTTEDKGVMEAKLKASIRSNPRPKGKKV